MRAARALAGILLAAAAACGQTTVADLLERKLAAKIRNFDERLEGVLGVAAIDLQTGRTFAYNADVIFPQASSIKIPIMIEVFRAERAGRLRFDDSLTLTAKDLVGGSGLLQTRLKQGPVTISIRELVRAMIEHSDNLATNQLIGLVGMEAVNGTLAELGFHATRLARRMMDSAAAARDEENRSTPLEMARLVELLYRGKVVDPAASREMLDLMRLVKADFRKAVPANIDVASKPGDLPGVHCETGIVFLPRRPFALSVMSTYLPPDANPLPGAVSLVYAYFESLAGANRYGHKVE